MLVAGRRGKDAGALILSITSALLCVSCAGLSAGGQEMPGSRSQAPEGKYTVVITDTVTADGDVETVRRFFVNLEKYYLLISPDHRKFEVRGGGAPKLGSLIDDEEESGGQYVTHLYKVTAVRPDGIEMLSNPSVVRSSGLTMSTPTAVTFQWTQTDTGKVEVSTRVDIHFDSFWDYFMATLAGTRDIWQNHVKGEMAGAARLIAEGKV